MQHDLPDRVGTHRKRNESKYTHYPQLGFLASDFLLRVDVFQRKKKMTFFFFLMSRVEILPHEEMIVSHTGTLGGFCLGTSHLT